MATVRSLAYAGKSVNASGHTEYREEDEKSVVDFDDKGFATVSEKLADDLVRMYPRLIEKVTVSKK